MEYHAGKNKVNKQSFEHRCNLNSNGMKSNLSFLIWRAEIWLLP
jgi:hypothetical protein